MRDLWPDAGNGVGVSDAIRQSMDSVLSELRAAGDFDSSGSFTLDPSKALQKMRQFQVQRSARLRAVVDGFGGFERGFLF